MALLMDILYSLQWADSSHPSYQSLWNPPCIACHAILLLVSHAYAEKGLQFHVLDVVDERVQLGFMELLPFRQTVLILSWHCLSAPASSDPNGIHCSVVSDVAPPCSLQIQSNSLNSEGGCEGALTLYRLIVGKSQQWESLIRLSAFQNGAAGVNLLITLPYCAFLWFVCAAAPF